MNPATRKRTPQKRRAAHEPKRSPAGVRPKPSAPSSSYTLIYAAVRRIPRGRVATYGQIAALAGLPGHARQVGYAMHALPQGSTVPWHRVINAAGAISLRATEWGGLQRALLEAEGVRFDRDGLISLDRFGWRPRAAVPRATARRKAVPTRGTATARTKRPAVRRKPLHPRRRS